MAIRRLRRRSSGMAGGIGSSTFLNMRLSQTELFKAACKQVVNGSYSFARRIAERQERSEARPRRNRLARIYEMVSFAG
jgi:hypothetical protein